MCGCDGPKVPCGCNIFGFAKGSWSRMGNEPFGYPGPAEVASAFSTLKPIGDNTDEKDAQPPLPFA